MRIQITTKTENSLAEFPAKFRKPLAAALSKTAFDVRDALGVGMASAFDRPTPFTMRAFKVDGATAGSLVATVYAMPLQARYLFWEIEGGERNTKGFEKHMGLMGGEAAIPGQGAKLNVYGNMSMAFIKQVSSDQNTRGTAKRFFIGTPKGWLADGTFDGVWARVDDNNRLVRVMAFAEEAQYKTRFDMSAIAGRTIDARFESQLMRAIEAAK